MYKSRIRPLIKWTGGKSSELQIIKEYLPKNFNNYFEPFLGGGAVWLAMDINKHKSYVNDYSEELINLYNLIKSKDMNFVLYISEFAFVWEKIEKYISKNQNIWVQIYKDYKSEKITINDIEELATAFTEKNQNFVNLYQNKIIFKKQYIKQISDKMKRMVKNDKKRGTLTDEDIVKNIATAFKASLYIGCRELYNQNRFKTADIAYSTALYFIMRNYSYSGMFRYNSLGNFNVPYGGISYNTKNLALKLQEYNDKKLEHHLKKSKIYQGDFEDFLTNKKVPKKEDFIFLDPPYDSEFSAYEGNKFEAKEQKRLATYLLENCEAQWMMVIKYTDFIFELYNNKKNVNITFFDKKYAVSIMDRNNKEVQHIIIKNY